MDNKRLRIIATTLELSVCRFAADAALPAWATKSAFFCVTRTKNELSVVCESSHVSQSESPPTRVKHGWRALEVAGPLDFSEIGILATLSSALAKAGVSIFAISTFDTDYLLVGSEAIDDAKAVLAAEGHFVEDRIA